jgi:hypothetical protein
MNTHQTRDQSGIYHAALAVTGAFSQKFAPARLAAICRSSSVGLMLSAAKSQTGFNDCGLSAVCAARGNVADFWLQCGQFQPRLQL